MILPEYIFVHFTYSKKEMTRREPADGLACTTLAFLNLKTIVVSYLFINFHIFSPGNDIAWD